MENNDLCAKVSKLIMAKYEEGFNIAQAKRLAEAIRSEYEEYIQPSNSDRAICMLLDRVEQMEEENNKLSQIIIKNDLPNS